MLGTTDQTLFGNLTVAGTVTSLCSKVPTDPFGDLRTVQRVSVLDIKSTFGLSTLRDVSAVVGTGAVTGTVGTPEIALTVAAASDSATLQTAERGCFVSGFGVEAGIAVRLSSATLSGNQRARWGYYDGVDGAFFQLSSTGLALGVSRASVETIVSQSAWNVDKLDGTGPSGLTLDVTRGAVFQVVLSCGYGAVAWRVALPNAVGAQVVQTLHTFYPSGATSIATPHLPVYAALANLGTAGSNTMYVAGRAVSVIGPVPVPTKRLTTAYALNVTLSKASGFLPILSVSRKTGYVGNPMRVASVDFIAGNGCAYELRAGSTLTGASYGPFPDTVATETAMQLDTTATAGSGGVVIYAGIVAAGATTVRLDDLPYSIEGLAVTLFVYCFGGNSASLSCAARFSEEW